MLKNFLAAVGLVVIARKGTRCIGLTSQWRRKTSFCERGRGRFSVHPIALLLLVDLRLIDRLLRRGKVISRGG